MFPRWTTIVLALALAGCGVVAAAEGRVELELVTGAQFPATAQQQWYNLLSELGVDGLRIRKAGSGDKAEVKVAGSKASPVYRVVGLLVSGNELVLPGGRFSPRDRGPLAEWLKKLRTEGPTSSGGGAGNLPFGLATKDFAAIHADLTKRVAFSTQGMPPVELLDKLAAGLTYRLSLDAPTRRVLGQAGPIGEELEGLSTGTAIAYVLRSEGLGLLPAPAGGKGPKYAVLKPSAGQTTWPVGWPLQDRKPGDVMPKLFETLNAEIEEIPLTDVLDTVVGERLKAPVLYDHYALARQGIELQKAIATFPPGKTWYYKLVDKLLHRAGLKGEWRLDDGGKPLLWVTTLLPVK
ncbi:MAG TPA: hypothetical protein VNH11_19025 [Pirellulales bacterium]|nr:hypothetical protein [Pirellulales bacterium]